MKIIYKIARAELRYLFFSPVAWFVLLVFYVFVAAIFFIPQEKATMLQEVLMDLDPNWLGFNEGLFVRLMPEILKNLAGNLYMFIPLLTMGLINREVTSGSIKLLYSSPISSREIVLGKYLGMVCFNMLLLLGLVMVILTACFTMEHPETGWFLSVLTGFFLLVNAYTAIGLFISCLTNYQIVAAVLTFATFYLLTALSGLWQQYDLFRDFTYALSLSGKIGAMMRGMITSRDIIYYLLIIVLFLGFAIIRLNSKQEPKKWTANFSRYGLLFLLVLTVGYFTSRPGFIAYADMTRNKINTLTPDVQDVLKKLDGSPVTVTLYTNLFHRRAVSGLPQNRNEYILLFWEKYIRFYPNLKFRYEYYYDIPKGDSALYKEYPKKSMDEIAAIRAEVMGIRPSLFKKPSEVKNIEMLRAEDLRLLMELEYKGRKSVLGAYEDGMTWPDPDHVAGSFMKLVREKDVKATFLTGHFERNPMRFTPRDFGKHATLKSNRKSLINKGIDSDTISIMDKDIPANLDVLVVADPRSPYSEAEIARIDKYIANGGNAIIYSEPGKQFILAQVLKKIGIQVDSGMIVHPDPHERPNVFFNYVTKEGNYMSDEPEFKLFQWYGKFGGNAVNEGAANITATPVDGFKVEPVIYMPGDNNTWIENGLLVLDSAAPVFSAREGDVQKEGYNIAVKLSRKINNKEQRIIVAGDADFMSGKLIDQGKMGLAFYNWCLYNKYPVYANYRLPEDRRFRISNSTATMMINIYVYLIPAILLVTGSIILVRRKRK